jgi:ComF family protein
MKYERAQAGIREAGQLSAAHGAYFPADAVLVHVPTATGRVRTRGYDQARLLAREISRASGLRRQRLLARSGQTHQMGSGRTERLRQLEGAFRPLRLSDIQGKHIVLVDDVLTTGTTLELAARVLMHAGAARVDALVFAQA